MFQTSEVVSHQCFKNNICFVWFQHFNIKSLVCFDLKLIFLLYDHLSHHVGDFWSDLFDGHFGPPGVDHLPVHVHEVLPEIPVGLLPGRLCRKWDRNSWGKGFVSTSWELSYRWTDKLRNCPEVKNFFNVFFLFFFPKIIRFPSFLFIYIKKDKTGNENLFSSRFKWIQWWIKCGKQLWRISLFFFFWVWAKDEM